MLNIFHELLLSINIYALYDINNTINEIPIPVPALLHTVKKDHIIRPVTSIPKNDKNII